MQVYSPMFTIKNLLADCKRLEIRIIKLVEKFYLLFRWRAVADTAKFACVIIELNSTFCELAMKKISQRID